MSDQEHTKSTGSPTSQTKRKTSKCNERKARKKEVLAILELFVDQLTGLATEFHSHRTSDLTLPFEVDPRLEKAANEITELLCRLHGLRPEIAATAHFDKIFPNTAPIQDTALDYPQDCKNSHCPHPQITDKKKREKAIVAEIETRIIEKLKNEREKYERD